MGGHFSSQRLSGGVENGVPTVSYAYSTANPNYVTTYLGADATFTQDAYASTASPIYGEITPYLYGSSAFPTVTCSPFTIAKPSQSLKCAANAPNLDPGLYTLAFAQYQSTSASNDANGSPVYAKATYTVGENSLRTQGYFTFSLVKPTGAASTLTTTLIVTPTATTTVTSGVSEILATSTQTVPQSISTVTVYQTTIISTQTSLSTLTGASTLITVTAACPSTSTTTTSPATTLLKCNSDNCLRALKGKSASASAFCSQYTKTLGMATPTYASQCSGQTSRVSSACSCLVAPTNLAARGAAAVVFLPPQFTYGLPTTQTTTAAPITTQTSGPVPSTTVTDSDSTFSSGTSTSTDLEPSTVTVTIFQSTVNQQTAGTVTVQPTDCSKK